MRKILSKTFNQWLSHDPFTYSASAAYYAVLSMPGLLMTIIAIAAMVFDRPSVENEILQHIRNVMGSDAAETTYKIVESVQDKNRDAWTMLVGTAILLFGATGLFVQLQRALNHIWEVKVKKTAGFVEFIKHRATAFGIMMSIGFLLLVSLSITMFLTTLSERLSIYFPAYLLILFHALDFTFSLVLVSFLFALMFKVLPDVHLKWRYAMGGGLIAAILFRLGEYALGIYFEAAQPHSVFGAAGSIILFMLWVSYSCLILLFGAEFTRVYAGDQQEPVKPTNIAKR